MKPVADCRKTIGNKARKEITEDDKYNVRGTVR